MLGRSVVTIADRDQAQGLYAELVAAGHGLELWITALNRQIYLGDDDFVVRMLDAAAST